MYTELPNLLGKKWTDESNLAVSKAVSLSLTTCSYGHKGSSKATTRQQKLLASYLCVTISIRVASRFETVK